MKRRLKYLLLAMIPLTVVPAVGAVDEVPAVTASSDFDQSLAAALRGDSEAMRRVASCYQSGAGVDVDLGKAWEWLGKAAAEGNVDAEYDIGVLYRDGIGRKQNYKEAAYWFRKAASHGHPLALVNIARQFAEGNGVLQDYRIAAENYWRAAERGNPEGAYYYACMLRDGLGVEKNLPRAYVYFSQAASCGYKDASGQAAVLKPYASSNKRKSASAAKKGRHDKSMRTQSKKRRNR